MSNVVITVELGKWSVFRLSEPCSGTRGGPHQQYNHTNDITITSGINGLTTFQKDSNERKIKILANEMIPLTKEIEMLDVR